MPRNGLIWWRIRPSYLSLALRPIWCCASHSSRYAASVVLEGSIALPVSRSRSRAVSAFSASASLPWIVLVIVRRLPFSSRPPEILISQDSPRSLMCPLLIVLLPSLIEDRLIEDRCERWVDALEERPEKRANSLYVRVVR